MPCLITRIEAGPDLSARLTLVDLAPGIHGADTGPIPPFESFVSRVPVRNRLPPWPPLYVAIDSDEIAMLETSPGTWMISIRVAGYAPRSRSNRLVPTLMEVQFRPVGSAAQWQQVPPQTVTAGGVATFWAHPVQERCSTTSACGSSRCPRASPRSGCWRSTRWSGKPRRRPPRST